MSFIPDLSVLAVYSLAVVFLTLTPGPDMALYLGKTVTQGRRAGLASFLGTNAGLLIHSTLAAVGLSAVLAASATAFLVLKVAGAAYLLWLAVDAVRNGAAFSLEAGKTPAEPLAGLFVKGFLINVLNPKIVVFFITFLPQFIAAGDPNASGKLFFLGLWLIAVAFPITVAMILAAHRIAAFLKSSPRALKAFDWLFAGVMAAFAVKLALARA